MELLIGCGSTRDCRVATPGRGREWTNLVTLDNNPDHNPDVVHDLNVLPWPFADNTFDEVHAYEVLEHLGRQGDWQAFFDTFSEIWRILKPGGYLAGTTPSWNGRWAWSDPSHTRVISSDTLVFLDQDQYAKQVGVTAMSDFRFYYKADFSPIAVDFDKEAIGEGLVFVVQAVKPSRLRV